jgi:hypothetical protein
MDGALAARIIAPPQPLVSHQHAAESVGATATVARPCSA